MFEQSIVEAKPMVKSILPKRHALICRWQTINSFVVEKSLCDLTFFFRISFAHYLCVINVQCFCLHPFSLPLYLAKTAHHHQIVSGIFYCAMHTYTIAYTTAIFLSVVVIIYLFYYYKLFDEKRIKEKKKIKQSCERFFRLLFNIVCCLRIRQKSIVMRCKNVHK